MAELGDDRIDLLKLDIEGGEYELLPALDLRALGVRIFATQLHHSGTVRQARALIAWLRESGYEPVGCRPAVKVTFLAAELLELAEALASAAPAPQQRRPAVERAGQSEGRSRGAPRRPSGRRVSKP